MGRDLKQSNLVIRPEMSQISVTPGVLRVRTRYQVNE